MLSFNHIHQVLIDAGYPESCDSAWYIKIYDYQDNLMIPHWYACYTKERAKTAVKSLLNKTDIYQVTVYSPICNPISFHTGFGERAEHEWNYYFQ